MDAWMGTWMDGRIGRWMAWVGGWTDDMQEWQIVGYMSLVRGWVKGWMDVE